MRLVIKGENYTEIRTTSKDQETIRHWHLHKNRKREKCGVWQDGKQICTWETMR